MNFTQGTSVAGTIKETMYLTEKEDLHKYWQIQVFKIRNYVT
jgi:hypothetical protein